MGLLTKVEDIISIPLELFHNKKGFHPVDLNRLAQRCMEQGSRKGIKKVYAPNRFRVLLHLSDYEELYPFIETICADMSAELRRVAKERKYILAGDIQVEMVADPDTREGEPQIKGHMEGNKEPESTAVLSKEARVESTKVELPSRDEKTVVVLPPDEQDAEIIFEEGVTNLREGRPEEAYTVLLEAEKDLKSFPEYQAAMAVALEAMGKRTEALGYYRHLEKIAGPQPEFQRRLEMARPGESNALSSIPQTSDRTVWADGTIATLETPYDGVFLGITGEGIRLQNLPLQSDVTVNGQAVTETLLKDGDRICIGSLEMTYRAGVKKDV